MPLDDVQFDPADDVGALIPVYSIVNDGSTSLEWEVRVTQPWLAVIGSTSGELLAGESIDLEFEVDATVASEADEDSTVADILFVDSGVDSTFATRSVTIETEATFATNDSAGWTTFTASAGTRKVYVSSSSGNDANDGLTESRPKRTIAAGRDLLRHGNPDWLLLKRGDVWQESLGQWKKSGRSPTEPMLVSSYGNGSERPRLETGTQGGVWTSGGGGTPATIDNLALVGVHFYASGFTGTGDCVGVQWFQPSSNILIEDCHFQSYSSNLVFQGLGGRHKNLWLRRSVIVDAYSIHGTGNHPQGLYAYGVDKLVIEDNVFDHNGWNENVPGAGADIFSHNMYIDNGNTGVIVRGNIIADAASHGMQLRCGGSVVNNLFLRNSIALSVGGGNAPETAGVKADVRNNVILDGKDIDAANPRGWGMCIGNISSGRVAYNVIANNTLGSQPVALVLDGDHVGDDHPSIGVHHLVIEKNVLSNWGGSLSIEGTAAQISDITLRENDLQDAMVPDPLLEHSHAASTPSIHSSINRFHSQLPASGWTRIGDESRTLQYWMAQVGDTTSNTQAVSYDEPDRSAATYNLLVGEIPSHQVFVAQVRQQSRTDWRPEYLATQVNRYLRLGFLTSSP